jgi:predicted nucleic acid-binding protein
MRKAILDTDILSEFLKGMNSAVVQHGRSYAQEYGIFSFTSVTVFEMVAGLESKKATRQLDELLAWVGNNEQILPVEEDYLTAAKSKGKARTQGITVELPDCLIAAVASRLGLILVTGNTEDFEAIKRAGLKLTLENWRKP